MVGRAGGIFHAGTARAGPDRAQALGSAGLMPLKGESARHLKIKFLLKGLMPATL
jgi:hypothetical protein